MATFVADVGINIAWKGPQTGRHYELALGTRFDRQPIPPSTPFGIDDLDADAFEAHFGAPEPSVSPGRLGSGRPGFDEPVPSQSPGLIPGLRRLE